MMPLFYFWMSVIGISASWGVWTFLLQDLFLDIYRSELFECRAELLALVESGDLRYDDPAYTSIRLVINGLIRYGHKITFGLYLFAAIHEASKKQKNDEVSVGQQIMLHISRQNPYAKQKLIDINARIHRACIFFILVRSVLLQSALVLWLLTKPFRKDDTERVKDELVNQVQKDALRAYRWEQSQPALA